VERALDLESELSVLVARRPSGETAIYPPALNHHVNRVLDWSVLPGPLSAGLTVRALEIARAITQKLTVEGLLVVELFHTKEGELFVNELAPRPHNSFHSTEVGCFTSQFEQLVRAICDLPLGSTEVLRPAAIVNLLGDLWVGNNQPAFDRALALPGVGLHLYGKRVPRAGRKMGHLSAVGTTPEDAVARVLEAKSRL
jgi:5-(carboxyamino)imidazole ribonucleotide synthase